jgi:hypothetical protein
MGRSGRRLRQTTSVLEVNELEFLQRIAIKLEAARTQAIKGKANSKMERAEGVEKKDKGPAQ